LRGVACLGGYVQESAITPSGLHDVLFLEDRLVVSAHRQAKVLAEVPYGQVEDVEIGGPGVGQDRRRVRRRWIRCERRGRRDGHRGRASPDLGPACRWT